ncbi:MAG: hypothetical protein WA971_11515 [Microbacterium sp.]
MRKTSAALAALALSAVALTGCSVSPTFDGAACDRSASSHGLDGAVSVTGDLGSPKAEVHAPTHFSKIASTDLIAGDGTPLTSTGQVMTGSLQLFNGTTGAQLVDTGKGTFALRTLISNVPGLDRVLGCATGGSRVLGAIPAKDLGSAADGLRLAKDDTLIVVADIDSAMLPRAEGSAVFNDAHGLPTVVRAPDGRPGIIVPTNTASPKKQVTQTLIKGAGAEVADQAPVFAYTSVGWTTRKVERTTWDEIPSADLSALPEGLADAVKAATVGSQLMAVIPGKGDEQASVYVVDILGTLPPSGQ